MRYTEAQAHLSRNDPVMAALITRYGDCAIEPHTDYYRELIDAIISQQLSVKAGRTIMTRFMALYGGATPTPKQIIDTDIEVLRSVGCSYAKVSYIRDLAQHLEDGRLNLHNLAALPDEEVITHLVAIKGIGTWSAHMFMIFCLGRSDILPTGDLGIRNAVAKLYGLSTTKPKDLLRVSRTNNWQPYQSIASWYLWRSLDNS